MADDHCRRVVPETRALADGRAVRCQTDLRPVGKVLVDGRTLDATTRGEFLEAGAEAVILRVEGANVVVRASPVS